MNKSYIYFLLALLFFWGCSTKKNTWVSRNFHNLTAHYNVYFNGNESFKEGVKSIEDSNEDDYTQILTVFPDSKESAKDVAISEMDRAIEKGTKLIKKHSITKKPKRRDGDNSIKYQKFISQNEFNKWVDNAYLLIGKSHFYKHEYSQSQQSFAYMFREFRTGPEWYEAEIWNARAAIELGDLAKAKILLDNYDIEGKAPEKLYGFFASVYADYYLRQEMYSEAIPYLQEAIIGAWSRYYRLRLNFILAQVYHKMERYNEASVAYKKVINMNPPYEMAFNAKVNRASVMFGEGGLPAVQKEIARLLRDKRNQDYEDQIYYALAMAYKAEQQEENAVENLLLSVEKSVSNEYQKGMSFYQLADIHYERPEYKPAYTYLDSALLSLDETFYNYEAINDLHKDLEGLVSHLNTVEKEDSLQRIAKMGEQARLAFIDELIAQEKSKQEELKKQQAQSSDGDLFFDSSLANSLGRSNQGGKWYFYNPTSVSLGKSEFERRWGRRKLEDNWRRANKEVVAAEIPEPGDPDDIFGDPLSAAQEDTTKVADELLQVLSKGDENLLSRDTYLKDLPLTEAQLVQSDQRIEEALISMGIIYKDEIENIPYAIDAFEELLKRFPNSKYLEDALMNLYLCYEMQDDGVNMAQTKKKIETLFPDGEFTAFLNDPDYFRKREEKLKKVEELYQQAYTDYLFSNFDAPISNYAKAKELDEDNKLMAKFKFLSGLSYAKLGDLESFAKELKAVTESYPDDEVAPVAEKMLALYKEGRTPVKGPVTSNLVDLRNEEFSKEKVRKGVSAMDSDKASSFVANHKTIHSLILAVNTGADLNRLKFNIADYNFSKFLLNDYEMSETRLPDGSPVFAVNGFNNRLEALDYFYSIRERSEIFNVDNMESYKMYVINAENLEFLLSSGDLKGYDAFFTDNYLSAEAFKNIPTKEEPKDEEKIAPVKETQPETNKGILQKQLEDKRSIEKPVSQESQTPTTNNVAKEPVSQQDLPGEKPLKTKETKVEKQPKVEEKNNTPENIDETNEPVTKPQEEAKQDAIIEKPSNMFVVEEGKHSALILFKKGRINIQRTGTIFQNYTKANIGNHLQTEFGPKGTAWLYIKVSGFTTAEEAKKYAQRVRLDNYLMREISRMQYYTWAISDNNYQRLTDEESFNQYDSFYKSNY